MPPLDWLGYLDVSEDLPRLNAESHLRASAGRSYYGVFGLRRLQRIIEENKARLIEAWHDYFQD